MCGYCNGYDDYVFLGEENSGARISAMTNVFGADFHSKKIKINYCPFCGKKL